MQTPWLHLVLFQPQIPQNTGSIGRMAYALNIPLHIIGPCGFLLDESHVRRAGLEYWPKLTKYLYSGWDEFIDQFEKEKYIVESNDLPIFPVSTMGLNLLYHIEIPLRSYVVFGSEDKGLPAHILNKYARQSIALPQPGAVRSLNLAQSAAITAYELYRKFFYN